MKGTRLVLTIALAAFSVARSEAQTVVRPDISASIGWLNVNKSSLDDYNDWYNRGVHGAVAFGWYWTSHLKTEIEPSASSRVEFYSSRDEIINGQRAHVVSEFGFSTRRLTLSQQYQFGENAWFHPHLAAGLDFNWEKTARDDRYVYFLDVPPRQPPSIPQNVTRPTANGSACATVGRRRLQGLYDAPFVRQERRAPGHRRSPRGGSAAVWFRS